jgi:hypothetical protein
MKIYVERVDVYGMSVVLGFTEDDVSFLFLSTEEFEKAEKIGNEEDIKEMIRDFQHNKNK